MIKKVTLLAASTIFLFVAASTPAQDQDDPPTPKELAQAEGVFRFRITQCQVPADFRPYAEILSRRTAQVIGLTYSLTLQEIDQHIAEGMRVATEAQRASPSDWQCGPDELKCLLAFFDDRDSAISEMIGPSSMAKPAGWPAKDPNCDDDGQEDQTKPERT